MNPAILCVVVLAGCAGQTVQRPAPVTQAPDTQASDTSPPVTQEKPASLSVEEVPSASETLQLFAQWSLTTEGLAKLAETIGDSKYSPSAWAYACRLMISEDKLEEVMKILQSLSEVDRHSLVSDLAPRLWSMARIDEPLEVPRYRQTRAKDAMYYCLDFSDEATEAILAEYLIEYFVGGYYEGRATAGEVSGARVMLKLGQVAAGPLITRTQLILDTPADASGRRLRVGDRLLRAIALTGSPQALRFLMNLYQEPNPDSTVAARVIAALNLAYVRSDDGLIADSRGLHAIADELEAIAQITEVKPLVEVLRRAPKN